MRAIEFITESKESFEGITIEMTKHQGEYNNQLVINALSDDDWGNGKLLGFVIFGIGDNNELDPQELEVSEKYRGQGIAKVMYDYVKSKGYKIIRSPDQTPDGKYFWDKNRGEEVNVWEDGYDIKNFNFDTEPYEGWTGEGLIVKAFDGKDEVGHVIFEPTEDDDTQWYAIDVEVEEPYQRRGIASQMYNIAKKAAQAQGKIIVRSHTQSQAGQGLWKDKRVWENRK